MTGNTLKRFTFISLILLIFNANAVLNTQFTYQGELVENNLPVNGDFEMEIKFFDAETNGNYILSNYFPVVAVSNGLFSIDLDIGIIPFIQSSDVWIEVNFFPPMSPNSITMPRQLITNTPFAIHAQTVADNSISGSSIFDQSIGSDDLGNSIITTAKISDGAVNGAKIADHSIDSIDILDFSLDERDFKLNSVTSGIILNNTITNDDVNSSLIQERVNGTCPAGSSIRVINQNGTVTCETDDSGSSGWSLNGNIGTTAGTNFIGTSDNEDFIVKVNNTQAIKLIAENNNIIVGDSTNTIPNTLNTQYSKISGGKSNIISALHSTNGATVSGGEDNSISSSSFHASYSTISGGYGNTAQREGATVAGGKSNEANGLFSTVSGGGTNKAIGENSIVPGGSSNKAGGDYSFAAGRSARVREASESGDADGDEGTFIWSSQDIFFTSTGPEQFLIDANGGVGIGTNDPKSQIHINGNGTSFGSTGNETILTLQNSTSTNNVALVLDKRNTNASSSLIFANNGSPEFDLRREKLFGQDTIAVNHYDVNNGNAKTTIIGFSKLSNSTRVDVNANIEPFTDDQFNIGTSSFRWQHVFTHNITSTNPLNVSSDKRLKDNIYNLDYGLAEVLAMRPVSYYWKKRDTDQLHLGLIAQEVESIIPEIVNKAGDDKQTRSMRYGELVPVLIKATQEQQILIEQQSKDIARLESMFNQLLTHQDSGQ